MPTLDSAGLCQKYPSCLESSCRLLMEHYNYMLSCSLNTEVDNFFYQEEFDQYKFYDV